MGMATRQGVFGILLIEGLSQPLVASQGGRQGNRHPSLSLILTTLLMQGSPLAEPNGKPEARGTQVSPLGHKARWRRW